MGLLSRLGKPGEDVKILAFSDNFNSFEVQKGWTRYARYLENPTYMEGVEINDAKPLIEKSGGKNKGTVYPVDFDKGQGFTFEAPTGKALGSYQGKERFKMNDQGVLIPDPRGDIERDVLVEVYPGLPVSLKDRFFGKTEGFMRVVKFDISPIRAFINTNPKLIGHATKSEILAESIRRKPLRFQLIMTGAICLLLGYLFHG